jgi:hypothetical protein
VGTAVPDDTVNRFFDFFLLELLFSLLIESKIDCLIEPTFVKVKSRNIITGACGRSNGRCY